MEVMATVRSKEFDSNGVVESFSDPCDSASVELSNTSQVFSREREAQRISLLRRTIKRIDAGTFGTCRSCRERISEKRLLANPTTDLCLQCKEEEEKKRP